MPKYARPQHSGPSTSFRGPRQVYHSRSIRVNGNRAIGGPRSRATVSGASLPPSRPNLIFPYIEGRELGAQSGRRTLARPPRPARRPDGVVVGGPSCRSQTRRTRQAGEAGSAQESAASVHQPLICRMALMRSPTTARAGPPRTRRRSTEASRAMTSNTSASKRGEKVRRASRLSSSRVRRWSMQ